MAAKEIKLTLTSSAKKWLMKKGYDRQMGARPMERTIEKYLKKPLADEMLFGCLASGKLDVHVSAANDELKIKYLRVVKV